MSRGLLRGFGQVSLQGQVRQGTIMPRGLCKLTALVGKPPRLTNASEHQSRSSEVPVSLFRL